MGQKSIQKILKDSFTFSDVESWKKTATSELDGSEPFTKLSWNSPSNLTFLPFYDGTNIKNRSGVDFLLPSSGDQVYGSRKWTSLPTVVVTDEVTANRLSLKHLTNGADGIFFDFQNPKPNLEALLSQIEWPYCRLALKSSNSGPIQAALADYFHQHHNSSASFAGNLFIHDLREVSTLTTAKDFKSLSFWIDVSTEVEEVVAALKALVLSIEKFEKDHSIKKVIEQVSFSISLEADFLSTVAKLRALRRLWYQVVRTYGVNDAQLTDLHIHGRSSAYSNEKFQPHANMLKSTIATMAGIIGGVDSLTVDAGDAANPMMNRIARNVSNILREESHFNKVSDPVAGAYAIEEMTERFCEQAWEMFQTEMKR